MSDDASTAVRAGHSYFKNTEAPSGKGSAMQMIDAAKDVEVAQTARLKAARQERDDAQAVADAETKATAPVKKARKRSTSLNSSA